MTILSLFYRFFGGKSEEVTGKNTLKKTVDS